MAEDVLITKYRPLSFAELIGHENVKRSLEKAIENRQNRAILFSGDSGIGKTTLARIAANKFGCVERNIIEIDAARFTGVDDMRSIAEAVAYKGFGGSPQKAVIVDEVHRLSSSAVDSILKSVEEPPEHCLWLFATTNESKVPNTLKTRCLTYNLKPLTAEEIADIVQQICDMENIEIPDNIFELIVKESYGSPRQALVNLSTVQDCKTRKDAAALLKTAVESPKIVNLCRFLNKNHTFTWPELMQYVAPLKDDDPESVRLVVQSYFTKVAINAGEDGQVFKSLAVLDAFTGPFHRNDRLAPIILALGRLVFPDQHEYEEG